MFIHHMTTIGLMVLSWSVNLTRVGTLVLLIHDCADIFLEVGQTITEHSKSAFPKLRDTILGKFTQPNMNLFCGTLYCDAG